MQQLLWSKSLSFNTAVQTEFNILFVVEDDNTPATEEELVITEMESNGHVVTLINDSDAVGDETGYDVIVLSEQASSANITDKYINNVTPTIVLEYGAWDDMDLASNTGTDTGETTLDVDNPAHPIAVYTGLTTDGFTIFDSSANIRYTSTMASGGSGVFLSPGTSRDVVFTFDQGDDLVVGTAAGRRVAIGIMDSSGIPELNANGWAIFQACILWAGGAI